MIKHILKITWRNIHRSRIYTSINIIGLSLGITCTLIIALWVKYELSFDKFHENPQDFYKAAFCYEPQDLHGETLPPPVAKYLKDNYAEVKNSTVFFKQANRKIVYDKNGFMTDGGFVDQSFFSMFNFPFLVGSPTSAFKDYNSIVLTKPLAERIFGDKNPVGEIVEIDLNGLQQFVVSSLLNECPKNSDIQFEFLIPYSLISSDLDTWDFKMMETYVQLVPGKDYEFFNTKIADVINRFKPGWNNKLYITPLTRCHLYNLQGGGRIYYVYIFSVVAFLILVIATFNFVNLTIARAHNRIREIGVKQIIGSRKRHLIIQFLFEAQILSFFALIISVVVTVLFLPSVNNLLNVTLGLPFSIFSISALLGFSIVAGLISGIYPALFLSSVRPLDIMKKNISLSGIFQKQPVKNRFSQKVSFRSVLVTFQFTLTIILISGIIIVRQQLKYISNKDLGFEKENVLVAQMQGDFQNKYKVVKDKLTQSADVMNVSTSSSPITQWGASCAPNWEGKDDDNIFDLGINSVDYDFKETMGLEMSQGRFFSEEFLTDASEGFVINEAAKDAMQLDNPIGKSISIFEGTPYERKGKIIGVVKNMHTESLHSEIRPYAFTFTPVGSYIFIKTNSTNISETVQNIRNSIKEIIPDDPATLRFLDDDLNELYLSEQTTEKLMKYSSVIAIIISCLGMFGLSYYGSQLRIKEVGLRKVNGAKVFEVIAMLNRDFVKWIVIAFFIAVPVAWIIMHRWLESFAFKTDLSWWIFALSGFLALGIALFTVSYQTWKAAKGNPVDALRHE